MARDEAPPFARGESYYNGGPIDTNNLGGVNLEGREYVFEDFIHNTGHAVRVRVVRNVSGGNLKPKKLVTFDADAYGRRVDSYAAVDAAHAFPTDELLPPAGVPDNDLFYIVVQGPALVTSPAGGVAVTVGDRVVAITAATSGAADAGRATITAATADAQVVDNKVGRAIGALTVAQTATDFLVGIGW